MRQQSITRSTEKLDAFGDYLGMGSQAEIWFKALQLANKTTWPVCVTAFETCWPPIVIAEKTLAEYEKELLEFLLTDKEVGTRTTLYHRECWTHVAWATKALQLAMSAGIAASTSMIWQVRGKLLSIVKDLLKDTEYMDWAEFTKEVTELKGTWLMEKKSSMRSKSWSAMQNTITALQNQLSQMTINPSAMTNAPRSNNTVTHTPTQTTMAYPQSTFARQPTAAAAAISSNRRHEDNAYATQIAQWNAKWGENTRVTHETGYPLKPGTVVIASSKCFDHQERLTRKEAAWIAIVSRVLGLFHHMVATPISLVFGHMQQPVSAWIEEIPEGSEGKGNGSGVREGIMPTQYFRNIQVNERVLAQGEAPHKDKSITSRPNPINKPIDNAPATSVPVATETIQIR
ncbi:hypothetical protein F4604DRAFT_1915803 [Suillus subluteus]|nr:hypothetical protein F4604DRAFT_1915803 [Suillus subluteus]